MVLVDQAIVSFANFVLAAAVVRYLDFDEIGRFALAVAYVRFVTDLCRARFSEPMLLVAREGNSNPRFLRASILRHFMAGLAGAAVPAVFGLIEVLRSSTSAAVPLAVAAILPMVLVHDSMRYSAYLARPRVAIESNLVLCGGLLITLAILPKSLPVLLLGWGSVSFISFVAGSSRLLVGRQASMAEFSAIARRRGRFFFVEAIVERGLGQVTLFVIAAVIGLAGSGQLHSGRLIFGLFNIALLGVSPAMTPMLVQRRETCRSLSMPLLAVGVVSALLLTAVTVGSLVDPAGILSASMGESSYSQTRPLLPWIGSGVLLGVLTVLLVTYLRVSDQLRIAFVSRCGLTVFVLVCATAGGILGGSAYAVAMAMALGRLAFVTGIALYIRFVMLGDQRGVTSESHIVLSDDDETPPRRVLNLTQRH